MAHPRTQQWRAPSSTLTPTPFHTYAYFKPQFLTFFGADAHEISRYCLPARVSQVVARPAHHAADLGSCSGCAKTPAAAATLCRFAQCRQPIFLFQQQATRVPAQNMAVSPPDLDKVPEKPWLRPVKQHSQKKLHTHYSVSSMLSSRSYALQFRLTCQSHALQPILAVRRPQPVETVEMDHMVTRLCFSIITLAERLRTV
ncbi:hypothetical protein HD554DRAFT_1797269 [Boletus coccyginus]|nr:hypothetical protein HD554DRAFT_1797269 [Boletus coccyginus]